MPSCLCLIVSAVKNGKTAVSLSVQSEAEETIDWREAWRFFFLFSCQAEGFFCLLGKDESDLLFLELSVSVSFRVGC